MKWKFYCWCENLLSIKSFKIFQIPKFSLSRKCESSRNRNNKLQSKSSSGVCSSVYWCHFSWICFYHFYKFSLLLLSINMWIVSLKRSCSLVLTYETWMKQWNVFVQFFSFTELISSLNMPLTQCTHNRYKFMIVNKETKIVCLQHKKPKCQ